MKVSLIEWNWTCGDGCCFEWGYDLYIDGEKIESFPSPDEALEWVLINRFSVVIEKGFEDDESFG